MMEEEFGAVLQARRGELIDVLALPGFVAEGGAVVDSRGRLKPRISTTGSYGIPVRDELELELRLRPPGDELSES
jgi:hypothetical protein